MNKKIRILILIVILILLALIIQSTYSKYTNKSLGTINENVGNWIIKINDKDITEPDENDQLGVFEIDDFTWNWDSAPNVLPPKVAPGMTGCFKLKVDPTGTDVSVKYTITIDDSKIEAMLNGIGVTGDDLAERINLKITGIKENGVSIELPRDDEGNIVISKIKELEKIKSEDEKDRIDELEIEVTWEDNQANNDIDSQIGSVPNNVIRLPIKVDVIQWTGEETTP